MNKKRVVWIVLNVIVVLALLMAGCGSTATPTLPPLCTVMKNPGDLSVNSFFVEGQVILSGDSKQINSFAESNGLELLASCKGPLEGDPEINLYQSADIDNLFSNTPIPAEISVDLNYLVGHLAKSACAIPSKVKGLPFGVEGSPFGVEGSPHKGGPQDSADFTSFQSQWALKNIGVEEDIETRRLADQSENGVIVALMDTSPFSFTDTTEQNIYAEDVIGVALTVHHPFDLPHLPPTANQIPGQNTNTQDQAIVKDHGLFVAGLVNAVAPKSNIHLYRVLDQNGCGDLFHLNAGIREFINDLSMKDKAVLNLSLGILKPNFSPKSDDEIAELINQISGINDEATLSEIIAILNDKKIESFEIIMNEVYTRTNVLIVSAAGNDSVNDSAINGMPMVSNLPAAFDKVIGVAASNVNGDLTCYSNQGDVMAPGGEAELSYTTTGTPQPYCEPKTEECSDNDPGCEWGLISLVYDPNGPTYAYWVGTSFSTSLVSGIAALYYQEYPKDTVESLILSNSSTPISIVTVTPTPP